MVILIALAIGCVGQQIALRCDGRQVFFYLVEHVCKAASGDDQDRIGILQQGFHGLFQQQGAQRHNHGPDLGAGPEGFQQFEAIGQYGGDVVAFFNTQGLQSIGQLIDTAVELRVRKALFLEHHRQMIGAVSGVSREKTSNIHDTLLT